MLYLIYIIVYAISFMVECMFINYMLHPKYSQKIVLASWCIYSFLCSCARLIPMRYSSTEPAYMVLSCAVFIVMTFLLYQEIWWKKAAAVVILYAASFIADICAVLGFSVINPQGLKDASSVVNANSILLGIVGIITLILFTALSMLVWSLISSRSMMKNFAVILLLPVCQLLFAVNEYGLYFYYHIESLSYVFVVAELLGAVLDIYWVYELVYRSRQAEAEMLANELRQAMEVEEAHYQQIEEKREVVAQIRHDLKNQITAARILGEKGEHEQAVEMLNTISEELSQTNEYPYCRIPIINAVLNNKGDICKQNDIVLDVDLKFPQENPFDNVTLCSLFSNLLDNAVYAASLYKGNEKWIKVRSIYEGGIFVVKVVNTSNPPEKLREGHGTGTKILNHIAEMYGGSYKQKYEDGEFTAVITLEVKNESGSRT